MIKKKLMPLMKQLEQKASWIPLDPTTLTVMGLVFAVFGLVAAFDASTITSFVFFLFAFAIDAVDGLVARAKGLATKQGAFLDGIIDRLVEFCCIIALMAIYPWNTGQQIALIFVLFFGTAMTSFVKAYAEHSGMCSHEQAVTMPGLLERPERGILLMLLFALIILRMFSFAKMLPYVIALLAVSTFVQRVFRVLSSK